MQSPTLPYPVPRSMQWALLLAGLLWMVAARVAAEHAAAGFALTLHFAALEPLLTEVFFLFLLLGGFASLHWIATRSGGVRAINALPKRVTSPREWLTGAALGWCMLLAAVLPMALSGDLHPEFWMASRAWGLACLSVLALIAGSLGLEIAFRGYLFRRLVLMVGTTAATLMMAFGYALLLSFRGNSTGISFAVLLLEGILFGMAYNRTHALWLGWGLRFGWTASMGLLFGMPVRGVVAYASVVETTASGRHWFTGGGYGPEGAVTSILVMFLAMVVLYSVTKDYAWNYTYEPIEAAGYAVVVQPPVAHTAMEQAAAPAPLVQIAAATSVAPSTMPVIEKHLRDLSEAGSDEDRQPSTRVTD